MQDRKWVTWISIVATAFVLFGPPNQRAVAELMVGGSGMTMPATSEIKTDFHVIVSSDTNIHVTDDVQIKVNGGAAMKPSNITGNGTQQVEFTWNGLGVDNTDKVSYSYIVTEDQENYYFTKTFFTPKQSPTDVPALGWRVTNDGHVFLENGADAAIHFDNLLFQFPPSLTGGALLGLLNPPYSGMTGAITSGDVPAASPGGTPGELPVGQFSLSPGSFLTATANTSFVDSSFSPITEVIALGHQHPTPEPASLLLLGTGAVSLMAWGWRRSADARPC
jgi:hypothetical protein